MKFFRKRLAGSESLLALAASSIMVLVQTGGAIASLAFTVILARLLTPEQFGAASSLWALALLLVPLATLNMASVAIRAVVKARQAGDDALAAGFILFARRAVLVTAPIAIAIFLTVVWVKYPALLAAAPIGVGLTAISIVGLSFIQIGAAIGVSLDTIVFSQVPRLLVRPLVLLGALLVFVVTGWPLGLNTVLIIYAASVLLVLGVQRYLLFATMSVYRENTPRIEGAWHWITTSAFLMPSRIVHENAKSLMIVVASVFLPLEHIALLSVTLSITGLFGFAITSIEMSFSARLSHALHADQRVRATRLLAVSGIAKLALSVVMVVLILLLLDPVLSAFGKHYEGAREITLILILIPISRALIGNANLVLLAHNLRKPIFWLQLSTMLLLPLGVLASLAFPALDPLRTTAIGFVFAFAFGYTALWWVAYRKTGIDSSVPGACLKWVQDRKQG